MMGYIGVFTNYTKLNNKQTFPQTILYQHAEPLTFKYEMSVNNHRSMIMTQNHAHTFIQSTGIIIPYSRKCYNIIEHCTHSIKIKRCVIITIIKVYYAKRNFPTYFHVWTSKQSYHRSTTLYCT